MLLVYLPTIVILSLVFLYLARVEIAWRITVKRRAMIERECHRKICLGESYKSARAWADGKHAEVESLDRMIFSLLHWSYEGFFGEELK